MSHLTVGTAPIPILFYIFRYVVTGFLETVSIQTWLQGSFADEPPGGVTTILSAPIVNKHWSSVATDVLYESIRLKGQGTTKLVWKTLSRSPHLASLVRRLEFGLPGEDTHIQIVSVCSNLMHLKFSTFHQSYVAKLSRSCYQLRSLHIAAYEALGLGLFCTLEEVLSMTNGWKHLEDIHIAHGALYPSLEPINFGSTATAIPGLRTLAPECRLPGLRPTTLKYIMHMAPNLEKFEFIHSRFEDGATMSQALEQWKNTLTALDLRCYPDTGNSWGRVADVAKWRRVAAVLPSLHKLQHLNLNMGVGFPESVFATMIPDCVQTLGIVAATRSLHALICAFQEPKFVPRLEILRLWNRVYGWGTGEFLDEELDTLTKLCNERGIEIQRCPAVVLDLTS